MLQTGKTILQKSLTLPHRLICLILFEVSQFVLPLPEALGAMHVDLGLTDSCVESEWLSDQLGQAQWDLTGHSH